MSTESEKKISRNLLKVVHSHGEANKALNFDNDTENLQLNRLKDL